MIEKAETPFRFDGHGVNDAQGRRIAKLTEAGEVAPYLDRPISPDCPTGRKRNPDFDALGELLAAAPELADALELAHASLQFKQNIKDRRITKVCEAALRKAGRLP